jgi:hypothetical protein
VKTLTFVNLALFPKTQLWFGFRFKAGNVIWLMIVVIIASKNNNNTLMKTLIFANLALLSKIQL